MQKIPSEQIQQPVQILLTFLDSDGASVPGNLLEGVVSGKSILRGLLSGSLGLVSLNQQPAAAAPTPEVVVEEVDDKKAA